SMCQADLAARLRASHLVSTERSEAEAQAQCRSPPYDLVAVRTHREVDINSKAPNPREGEEVTLFDGPAVAPEPTDLPVVVDRHSTRSASMQQKMTIKLIHPTKSEETLTASVSIHATPSFLIDSMVQAGFLSPAGAAGQYKLRDAQTGRQLLD